jgi:hypothetical protein
MCLERNRFIILLCLTDERLGVVAALVAVLDLSQVKVVELSVFSEVILDLQAKGEQMTNLKAVL